MKILVLGVSGMVGRTVFSHLYRNEFEVYANPPGWRPENNRYPDHEVSQFLDRMRPDIIINCFGKVKQKITTKEDEKEAQEINAHFPRRLARLSQERGIQVVHLSTDCVFSGKDGFYSEEDFPDALDLYGKTKIAGEIGPPHLMIRTSVIGFETKVPKVGLLEWFLSSSGRVSGYTNAWWNGVTSLEFGKVVMALVDRKVSGVYHVGSATMSKYQLLLTISSVFKRDVEIEPVELAVSMRRNLDVSKMLGLGIQILPIRDQLEELKKFYEDGEVIF